MSNHRQVPLFVRQLALPLQLWLPVLLWLTAAGLPLRATAQQAVSDPAEASASELAPAPLAPSETVSAVLQLPRDTPVQHFQAIVTLLDLGATEQVKELLEELTDQGLSDAQRAELVREFGTHRMVQLARQPGLADVAGPFVESSMEAAAAAARDPQQLAEIVAQLGSDSAADRYTARVDLAEAGSDGVAFVIEALAQEQDAEHRRAMQVALVSLEPLAVGPLLAALSTDNPQLEAAAIRVLGTLQVPQAVPLLAAPALRAADGAPVRPLASQAYRQMTGRPISLHESVARLEREVQRYRDGALPFEPDADGRIELWFWDDASNQLSSEHFARRDACVLWASRLAGDLYRLGPTDPRHRRQAALLGLEAAKLRQGYDTPLADLELAPAASQAAQELAADPHAADELLAEALATDCPGSAAAACEMLASAGDQSVLMTSNGRPSPLARALEAKSPRVRFAALEAIATIDPQSPYPGSSRVPKALAYFAQGTGEPVALVAMPILEKAASMAGWLQGEGYRVEITTDGNDLVRKSRDRPDVELILVDAALHMPGVRDTLYALRKQSSSASVPIGVLASAGREYQAQQVADDYPGTQSFSRPHSADAVAAIAASLTEAAHRHHVQPQQRIEQAVFAVDLLGRYLARRGTIYDVRSAALALEDVLYRQDVGERAIAHLAMVGTPSSQEALVNFADRRMLDIDLRRSAAAAFDRSVQKHGVLLTTSELLGLYDRYNASEQAEEQTQQVLGQLLDTLESQSAAVP